VGELLAVQIVPFLKIIIILSEKDYKIEV